VCVDMSIRKMNRSGENVYQAQDVEGSRLSSSLYWLTSFPTPQLRFLAEGCQMIS
jgi:hypothetical protein